MQETHCRDNEDESDIDDWKKEWGGRSEWSPGTSRSRGVAVLFNFDSEYEIESLVIDKNGRYIYFVPVVIVNNKKWVIYIHPIMENKGIKFLKVWKKGFDINWLLKQIDWSPRRTREIFK